MTLTISPIPGSTEGWWILDSTPMVLGSVFAFGDRYKAVRGNREVFGDSIESVVLQLFPGAHLITKELPL